MVCFLQTTFTEYLLCLKANYEETLTEGKKSLFIFIYCRLFRFLPSFMMMKVLKKKSTLGANIRVESMAIKKKGKKLLC